MTLLPRAGLGLLAGLLILAFAAEPAVAQATGSVGLEAPPAGAQPPPGADQPMPDMKKMQAESGGNVAISKGPNTEASIFQILQEIWYFVAIAVLLVVGLIVYVVMSAGSAAPATAAATEPAAPAPVEVGGEVGGEGGGEDGGEGGGGDMSEGGAEE